LTTLGPPHLDVLDGSCLQGAHNSFGARSLHRIDLAEAQRLRVGQTLGQGLLQLTLQTRTLEQTTAVEEKGTRRKKICCPAPRVLPPVLPCLPRARDLLVRRLLLTLPTNVFTFPTRSFTCAAMAASSTLATLPVSSSAMTTLLQTPNVRKTEQPCSVADAG
jgi:hypothetical protein